MVNLRASNGRSLYFEDRKEYYRRRNISRALKRFHAEKKEVSAQRFFRTLMQFNIKGQKDKSYPLSKIRIWINDVEIHTEREMRQMLRSVTQTFIKGFGIGLARRNIRYDAENIEVEEISKSEASELGKFQYFISIKGWESEGVI